LELLFPFLIKREAVNIYIKLAQYFMDNRSLRIDTDGESTVRERMEVFLKSIPDEQVHDDKTVVVLINTIIEPKLQPDHYYRVPDWAELKHNYDEEWKRLAYPHLFKEEKAEKTGPMLPGTEPDILVNVPERRTENNTVVDARGL
jgi:hypothetical protein